jgi:hypothetical protein
VNFQGIGAAIDADEAMDWVRGSLAQGSALAMSMTQHLESLTSAWLVAPEAGQPPRLDEHGRGFKTRDVDMVAARLLAVLARDRRGVLVVEDDLARRGDRNLGQDVAFVEDRVVRWSEIADHSDRAVTLLRRGSSGYPVNAFVCRGSARQLRLEPGSEIDAGRQALIVESVRAVIVSVYDAEAFVALVAPDVLR